MTVLTIFHNIFLTSDERHRLSAGEPVDVVGTSLPVWVKKGKSSEPASEVFCKYVITNTAEANTVKFEKDGYQINMPQKHRDWKPPDLDDGVWRSLTRKQRERWYKNNFLMDKVLPDTNLLDIKEGGSEYANFKEHSKVIQDEEMLEIVHFVTISDVKVLEESSTVLQTESHS